MSLISLDAGGRKARIRNLSSAILPDSSRRGIHMTTDHRLERRIMS